MRPRVRSTCIVASLLALSCAAPRVEVRSRGLTLEAEDAASKAPLRLWTFAVGVSKYRQADLALRYAAADARDIDAFYASPAGGSVPAAQRVLLTDEQATRTEVLDRLHKLVKNTAEDDMLVVFLALHGVPDEGELYFAMNDTDAGKLRPTGISQRELESELGLARAKRVLVVADACHAGAIGFAGVKGARGVQVNETNELIAKIASTGKGTAILSAASANEASQEDARFGGGHGAFTAALLEGLRGLADKDRDGFVTIREAYQYTSDRVALMTNGEQHPVLNGNFRNEMPIAKVSLDARAADRVAKPLECPPGTSLVAGGCAPVVVKTCPPGLAFEEGKGCVPRVVDAAGGALSGMVPIPAGTFSVGSSTGDAGGNSAHEVKVAAFYMDRTQVTVDAYAVCVRSSGCTAPNMGPGCNWGQSGRGNHPINCVDWEQAKTYCGWMGNRLPTAKEWEYAAYGTEGRTQSADRDEPTQAPCSNQDGTCEVGSSKAAASPFGVLDTTGNVFEWTASGAVAYRGDSWFHGVPSMFRAAARLRHGPSDRYYLLGFRCAR